VQSQLLCALREAALPPVARKTRSAGTQPAYNLLLRVDGRILVASSAVDMVNDGKLDEAEQAARDFLVRFPEVHDGYDRLGMVYEARGDNKQAATTTDRSSTPTRRPAIDGSRPKKSAQWVCWTFAVIAGDPESLLRLYLNAVTR
jgi:hypothetical protein